MVVWNTKNATWAKKGVLVLFEVRTTIGATTTPNPVKSHRNYRGVMGLNNYLPGNNHKEFDIWDGIIEKTEKRLANWKANYLSLGGRVTLINSVLDALPTYVMSLFPLPAKVEERLDKLRRDFLWLGNKEGKKIHLVKWQTALLSKKIGGLGIKNLRVQNKSLLSKWLWRFVVEDQALWRIAILNKYGQTEDSTYGVTVWRSIRNLWDSLKENLVVKVGEGNKIFFWKDKWIGQECLNSVFPDLFSFCTNPEAKIAEIWSPQGWNLTFRRNLNDWEVDRIVELLLKLGEFTGLATEADSIRWKHDSDGKLSVHRLYKREVMTHSGEFLVHGNKYGRATPQLR
ncbi:hypothetical protein MTR67_049429 [Solanum verrucosum]|uniref:Uncharacterized protein n=1 Tax=Solanum verrucosum TaxID=315347 RepID=A0AAF1A115_SOLVR|nr:hypothetical protein MTR67_049429 [Solanum verrucosum]